MRTITFADQPPFSRELEPTPMAAENSSQSSQVLESIVEETVGAGYFATLNEPVLAGREFDELDERTQPDPSKSLPVILNESAARKLFGTSSALARRVRDDKQSYEVVGVVHNMRDVEGLRQSIMYLPVTQRDFSRPPAGGITILVRSDGGTDVLTAIREKIALLDPKLNLFYAQALSDYLDRSRSAIRFSVQTYGAIGVFGLVLAAIGLAGVTAYAVAQRRKEIAIRTALGATKLQVLRLVLREGAALVMAGTVFGFVGAVALAKVVSVLANMFVDALNIGMNDPLLLVGAPLVLAGVALLACYLPARRTAKIDPLQVLREE